MTRRTHGLLVDTSNLHVGGGVQVGASVVNELADLATSDRDAAVDPATLTCMVSAEVASNLEPSTWESGIRILRADSSPKRWSPFPDDWYESILTVFGPHYRRRRAEREIVGFALGRMIYPMSESRLPEPGVGERFLNQIRWSRFGTADVLVTETEDSARRVRERLANAEVHVVPNCVSRSIADRALWETGPSGLLFGDGLLLSSIGNDYPHKNLDFLGRLGAELEDRLGKRVRFAVTLTQDEWARKTASFRHVTINVGVLQQRQIGPLLEVCAASVCPSVLEISSATPLESMHLGVPVFVSDLPAMRSAYGDGACFIDPWDAERAADVMVPRLDAPALADMSQRSRVWSETQPSPRSRALRLLQLMAGG